MNTVISVVYIILLVYLIVLGAIFFVKRYQFKKNAKEELKSYEKTKYLGENQNVKK